MSAPCGVVDGLDLRSWQAHQDGTVRYSHPALAEPLQFEQRPQSLASGDEHDGTFRKVWPAALSFGSYLCAHDHLVRGKTVVELGAGSGVAGILCAALGAAQVLLTDLPSALPLIEANLEANRWCTATSCAACASRWGDEADVQALSERAGVATFDVIVASELIYKQSPETFRALVETMRALGGAHTHILVVYEFRGELFDDAHFFDLMLAHYDVQTVKLNAYAPQLSDVQPGAVGAAQSSEEECEEFLYLYRAYPGAIAGPSDEGSRNGGGAPCA